MTIKAVIFDLGGVLFTLGEAAYRREVAHRLGLGEKLPQGYEDAVPRIQRGEESEEALWEALSGKRVALDAFDDVWEANFPANQAMLDLAAELRGRGLKTAVISNTQASHVAIIRRMGVLAPFEPVLMSCEVGCRKPEPAIFAMALQRLGLPAEQVAFVDDVPEYVAAAQGLGVHGVQHRGNAAETRNALLSLVEG